MNSTLQGLPSRPALAAPCVNSLHQIMNSPAHEIPSILYQLMTRLAFYQYLLGAVGVRLVMGIDPLDLNVATL